MIVIEQILNGVEFGITLFLISAGLTLIFGVMGVINLSHGSLYMIGAYAAALIIARTGSTWLALLGGLRRVGHERCRDRDGRGATAV